MLIITDLLKIPDATKESVTDSIKWNEVIEKAKENSKRKSTEKFIKEVLNVNNAVTVLGEYYSTKEKILCKCNACGYQWPAVPAHLLNGHGCPICGRKKANKAMTVTPHASPGRRSRPGSVRPAEHELKRAAVPRVPFFLQDREPLPADTFRKLLQQA